MPFKGTPSEFPPLSACLSDVQPPQVDRDALEFYREKITALFEHGAFWGHNKEYIITTATLRNVAGLFQKFGDTATLEKAEDWVRVKNDIRGLMFGGGPEACLDFLTKRLHFLEKKKNKDGDDIYVARISGIDEIVSTFFDSIATNETR